MGTENAAGRKQQRKQQRQRSQPKQMQKTTQPTTNPQQAHGARKKRALPSVAVTAGANWKNSSLKHDRVAIKPGKQRKAVKKMSSKPRDGKHVMRVAVASSSKKRHTGNDRHNSRAFPRGKRRAESRGAENEELRSHERPEPSSPSNQTPLDQEIADFVRFVSLTPKERAFRLRVFSEMKELICTTFEDATVQLYGSSSNGLDTFRSDLDITVGNITLSNSLRSAVHSTMLGDENADELEVDPDSDDEDYEDERYQPPHAADVAIQQAVKATADADDEPSFSLNIAMPVSSSSNSRNGSYSHLPAAPQSLTKSPWNPTLRRKKIRVLRALQYLLKVKRPQFQVKCLQKAKIPILMVRDPKSQLSIDVGVNREAFEASDHGRTTSLVIELQQVLGPAFTLLVTFLKEFLHQFELDKPFTGGLGSFRLYIMVASLFPLEKDPSDRVQTISKHIPSVSNLLRSFFHVFGNKRKPHYLQSSTVLRLPFDDSTVDFASVFRLDDCVDAFAMAHDILTKTNSLGAIIFEDKLADEREQVRKAMVAQIADTVNSARNQRSGHKRR
ncbi:hypothetical protein Gpo141_00011806 [Globisporangium polare]